MDTAFFLRAYDFLYKIFAGLNPDFDKIFNEFPDVILRIRKSELDTQLFSFNVDIEYTLLIFLRMGFPMLKRTDLESGNLDFIIDSGPSQRWISTSSELPPMSWSMFIDCVEEVDRKKFVLKRMLNAISVFEPLALSIITVNDSYAEQLLLEEGKVVPIKEEKTS